LGEGPPDLSRAVSPVPTGFLAEEVTPDSTLFIVLGRAFALKESTSSA